MGMGVDTGKNKNPTPVVNVTPLVDVALVVLIIFMVVTPMMTKTFWLNLPQKDESEVEAPPPDDKDPPLVMTIDAKGVVRVNQTVLAKGEIVKRLPRMLAAKKQRVLYFDAHDDVPYGVAVEVMDLSRDGGARSIAILTQKVAR
jgi:biopolymer transport protein ExbD/biopolymer transport protein TolR